MAAGYVALAGFQIISGAQQAEIVRDNAKLTQEINDMNAGYAELDAYNAEVNGMTQEARYQTVIDSTIGSQKVTYAAQNIDVGFGTAKEIQEETKLRGYLNKLDIRNKAHEAALGYKDQARQFRMQGDAAVTHGAINASATQNAAIINAAATGLTGYSKSGGKVF